MSKLEADQCVMCDTNTELLGAEGDNYTPASLALEFNALQPELSGIRPA